MRKILIVFIALIFYNYCFCQIDCQQILKNYPNTIDISKRPVYQIVERMPEIMTNSKLLEFFLKSFRHIDNSKCFPIYIYYGFVVEADCSISNIMICPTLRFCDENENIDLLEQKYIKQITDDIIKIKTNAGLLNGKKVAVYTSGRVHFDPQ